MANNDIWGMVTGDAPAGAGQYQHNNNHDEYQHYSHAPVEPMPQDSGWGHYSESVNYGYDQYDQGAYYQKPNNRAPRAVDQAEKPFWKSKIFITQVVKILISVGALFGLELPESIAGQIVNIILLIIAGESVWTAVLRLFFTSTRIRMRPRTTLMRSYQNNNNHGYRRR